jgi:hypothetical protein
MFGHVPRVCLATALAALVLGGLLTFDAGAVDAKKPPPPRKLFEVPLAADVLTPAQKKILERIKKSPAYVKDQQPQIVKLNRSAVADVDPSQAVAIPLPADKTLTIDNYRFAPGLGTLRVNWSKPFVDGKPLDFASFSVGEKHCTGLIYNADKVYSVENLGGGMQAIVQIDQSKYDDEHKDHKPHPPIPKDVKLAATPTPSAPSVIRVLVAYTPKVDSEVADMVSLIDGAINISNQSYLNSDIHVKLELALKTPFNYTESGSIEKDLERFRTDTGIAVQRDKVKADVCVLLLDTTEACGLAAAILADADHAFCVVHYDCAVSNLSFPHEIGHLQGARHNLEVDSTIDPSFPFNHGYLCKKGNWRTIMAYPAPGKPLRIPYWSNPNKNFGTAPSTEPMGTTDRNDNARMLNLSASRVSSFR